MTLPIHERLPDEIFRDILLRAACRQDDAHNVRQSSSIRLPRPHLRESIKFSSVCWAWRQIVIFDRVFWLNTSFTNFIYPSPDFALACMEAVLERCNRGFNCINLDFRSLKDAGNAEAIIEAALNILLKNAPGVSSSRWSELRLSAADEDHIDIISDYFLLTASKGARSKLSSITTLGVTLEDSQPFKNPSTVSDWNQPQTPSRVYKALPRFNTKQFTNLMRLKLTNVYAFIYPSNIYQSPLLSEEMPFELWLTRWTYIIEDSVIFSDSAMLPFHLVTDSYMNFVNSSLCSATALTILFPAPTIPVSPHEITNNFQNSPSIRNIAQFFLRNNFDGLRVLQLNNVTPRIWLTFLSLLKPLPSVLLTNDPFLRPLSALPCEDISVHFAPYRLQTEVISPSYRHYASPAVPFWQLEEEGNIAYTPSNAYHPMSIHEGVPSIKRIKEKLGLPFDVEVELWKVRTIGELQDLMIRCLPVFVSRLPRLRSISFRNSKGESLRLNINVANTSLV